MAGLDRIDRIFGQSAQMGALPTLYAAIAPDVQSGEYYGPDSFGGLRGYPKKAESGAWSHDVEAAKKLWQLSEEITQVIYP